MTAQFGTQTPQVEGSDYNTLQFAIQQALSKVNTCCVVKVVACTNSGSVVAAGTVDVQPLVNQMTGARVAVPHGTIYEVPYSRSQGGSDAIILDPKAGDLGVVVFSQRDITSVKAAKGQANPGSFRQFNWSDAIYVGGLLNGTPQQYLQFTSSGVTLSSPTKVTITAPVVLFDGAVEVTGAVTLDTTLLVTGLSTLTGGLTAPAGEIVALEVTSIAPIGGGAFTTPTFPVAVSDSIAGTGLSGAPLALVNDTASPGASMVYGTNGSGVRGWYAAGGGGGGGTVTSVGLSTVSGFLTLSGTNPVTGSGVIGVDISSSASAALAATAALAASALQSVAVSDSITGNGTSGTPLLLSGDSASPGNTFYYGTNGSGVKGWYALVTGSGTVTSVGLTVNATYIAIGGTASPITGSGTFTLDLSTGAKANLALAATAVQPAALVYQFIESAGWNSSSGAVPLASVVAQDIQIPYGCTLQEVRIQTQGPTGSCTVTLSTSAFPFVTGADITGGVPPAIASGTSYSNSTLTGWTTAFSQGVMIRATLTANVNFTSVKIMLRFK